MRHITFAGELKSPLLLWFRVALGIAAALCASTSSRAETLRLATTQAPAGLGNPFTGMGLPGSVVWGAVFDGLTAFAKNGSLRPALAVSWSNTTPLEWTFTLRKDVAFHNGRPFTAAAVVATFDYLRSDAGRRTVIGAELSGLTAVSARDDFTVVFQTREPDAVLPKRLGVVMIVEPTAWRTLGEAKFAQAPVGTGPYALTQWGSGDAGEIVLDAAPSSWRPRADVDRVEIKPLPDTGARLEALLAGRVDIAISLAARDLPALAKAGYQNRVTPQPNVRAIAFHTVRPDASPVLDKRVRQALNYAVNRDAIAKTVFAGLTHPSSQGAVPSTFGFDPTLKPYPYDPAKARALLKAAGIDREFTLKLDVFANVAPGDEAVFDRVVSDLENVGVKVDLRKLSQAQWLAKYQSGEWGDTDAFSMLWNSAPFNDVFRPLSYYSCAKSNPFFCDSGVWRKIIAANQMLDARKREAALQEIMRDLYDLAPSIWLVDMVGVAGLSPRIVEADLPYTGPVFESVKLRK